MGSESFCLMINMFATVNIQVILLWIHFGTKIGNSEWMMGFSGMVELHYRVIV